MGRVSEPPANVDTGPESGTSGLMVVMNPALQTLTLMSIVSLAAWTGEQANAVDLFMMGAPLHEEWWQMPVSVYAHSTPSHLAGNATLLIIVGGILSLSASWLRFHLFFVAAGILSGAAQVAVTDAIGTATPVIGASGAIFALVGYFITGNLLSRRLLKRVPIHVMLPIAGSIALMLTIWSAGMEVANVTHFTGTVIGLLAGHLDLLRPSSWSTRDLLDRRE